jgi:hypothetical protein
MTLGIADQLTVVDFHDQFKIVVAKPKDLQMFSFFFQKTLLWYTIHKIWEIKHYPSLWKKVQIKYVPGELNS